MIDNKKWLIDTGSPVSFGEKDSLSICNEIFKIDNIYGALNAKEFTSHIGFEVTESPFYWSRTSYCQYNNYFDIDYSNDLDETHHS